MKKHLIYLAAGALALTACTSEEAPKVDPVQGNAIGFENVVNKSSRADGDLTNSNFDNFMVYGYYVKNGMATPVQIFNGVSVYKKDNKWVYDGKRYWIPGYTYYFYAYSCADVALASGNGTPGMSLFDQVNNSIDNRALTLTHYRCDSEHQHDLITAENENITAVETGNPEVALSFSHALSKVKAEFITDFPEGYKVYVENVYLSSFFNYADYNVGTGVWSNYTGQDNTYYIKLGLPNEAYVENKADSKVTTDEVFVLPKLYKAETNENVRINFKITVKKDDVQILERNIHGTWSPQWNKGSIYKYSINISGSTAGIEPIVFAAEQSLSGNNSWSEATSVNMVFGVDANE